MSIEKDTRDLRVVAEGIRLVTLQTFANIGFGHVGGAMSIIDIAPPTWPKPMFANVCSVTSRIPSATTLKSRVSFSILITTTPFY